MSVITFEENQTPATCPKCGGEDVAADGSCADACACGAHPEEPCICDGPAEPDYDAPSFTERHVAAWKASR